MAIVMGGDSGMVVVPCDDRAGFEVRWTEEYGGNLAAFHSFGTRSEAEAWLEGYQIGAGENM